MRGFTAETGRSLAGSPGAAYVDHTAILCGKMIVHENVFIGPYAAILADEVNAFIGFNSVLFNCKAGNHSVVQHNSVVEGCTIPERFYIPSTTNIHSYADLCRIEQVPTQVNDFSEDVLRANHELVKGYKRLQNEF